MDGFSYGIGTYVIDGLLLYKIIVNQNEFSKMTDGEIRAVLDGAAGETKKHELLDFLTGMDIGKRTNPFYNIL